MGKINNDNLLHQVIETKDIIHSSSIVDNYIATGWIILHFYTENRDDGNIPHVILGKPRV